MCRSFHILDFQILVNSLFGRSCFGGLDAVNTTAVTCMHTDITADLDLLGFLAQLKRGGAQSNRGFGVMAEMFESYEEEFRGLATDARNKISEVLSYETDPGEHWQRRVRRRGRGLESGGHLQCASRIVLALRGEAHVIMSVVAVTGPQLAGQRHCSRLLRASRSSTSWYVTLR